MCSAGLFGQYRDGYWSIVGWREVVQLLRCGVRAAEVGQSAKVIQYSVYTFRFACPAECAEYLQRLRVAAACLVAHY